MVPLADAIRQAVLKHHHFLVLDDFVLRPAWRLQATAQSPVEDNIGHGFSPLSPLESATPAAYPGPTQARTRIWESNCGASSTSSLNRVTTGALGYYFFLLSS